MKKSIFVSILLCLSVVAFAQRSMEWYSYWGSNVAGSQIDPQRMVIDNEGNIYVAANFGGTKVGVESVTLNSNSAVDKGDAVIVKMSPAKIVLWTYSLVNTGSATVNDMVIDNSGNIVVTGVFNKSIKVGSSTMELDDSNMGEKAVYVLKMDAAGNAMTAWQIPAYNALRSAVAADSQDNVIVAGLLDGDATFIPGGEAEGDFNNTAQVFVAKYDKDGTHIWHQFRNDEGGVSVYGKPSLALDADDNIYLASAITGKTTFVGEQINATASNAFLLAYSAEGAEKWFHMIDGDEADEAAAVAVSPIGEVVLAINHHSGDLRIDDMSDVFNNGYAFDAQYAHSAFFSFNLNGDFKWFYDWGYSNGESGSDAICYSLRCTDEGVWYATGMMTGRFGGSRLPEEIRTLAPGKNSGVETIDNQWMQHNTNGGHDCYMLTLTRKGELANVIRPGGPQYEEGMDATLSPDKKSIYFLQSINVRDNVPYTCPDNIFDSWTDLYAPANWDSRKSNYTLLNVYCPENDGTSTNYSKDYKGIFASSLLVKYALPEITPNELPNFVAGEPYAATIDVADPKGDVTLFALGQSGDVTFDGIHISGTFDTEADRYVGVLAIDSIALPGKITYYEYDKESQRSLRSNPRACRYMALTTKTVDPEEAVENVSSNGKNQGVRKYMRDGIMYIERNGRLYNAQGAELR